MQWKFETQAGPLGRPLGGIAWNGTAMLAADVSESRILAFATGQAQPAIYRKFTNRINGIAFGPDGLLYGCQEGSRRIVQCLPSGAMKVTGMLLNGEHINHPSQLVIDRKGSVWFTDTYNAVLASGPQIFPYLPHQSILRMRLHGRPHTQWEVARMTFDTSAPAALALSPDEKTLYVAETSPDADGRRELRAYPIASDGSLGPYAVLHQFARDVRGTHRGIAGLCVSRDGSLFACAGSTQAGPGPMVYVFSPGGRILHSQPVPFDNPLNCAFGGDRLDVLHVTTADGHLLTVRDTGHAGVERAVTG